MGTMPVALLQDGEIYYIHSNQIHAPAAMTDSQGTVVWRWDPRPFGDSLADEDPDGDGQRLTFNLRFPGQYFDAETGLHYNYYRYYDPAVGRYVESDPIGLQGGLNTYLYSDGNPIFLVDPFGLRGAPPGMGSAGASMMELGAELLYGYYLNPPPGDMTGVYYCVLAHCTDVGDKSCDIDDYVESTDWAGMQAPAPWELPSNCACLLWGVR